MNFVTFQSNLIIRKSQLRGWLWKMKKKVVARTQTRPNFYRTSVCKCTYLIPRIMVKVYAFRFSDESVDGEWSTYRSWTWAQWFQLVFALHRRHMDLSRCPDKPFYYSFKFEYNRIRAIRNIFSAGHKCIQFNLKLFYFIFPFSIFFFWFFLH